MVLDPIPQSLPVHFCGSRPQAPTSHQDEQATTYCNILQHTTFHTPPKELKMWLRRNSGKTLQHTATHCNVLQHFAPLCITQQLTTTHCNTLQHTATHYNTRQHMATHSNSLQLTATHCSTLQHTAAHCNTLHHAAPHCTTLHYTAPHCTTLQHTVTATHCNTLQHTATHYLSNPPERITEASEEKRQHRTAARWPLRMATCLPVAVCVAVMQRVAVYCSVL